MTRALIVVALLGACKTAGTIELTFDLTACNVSTAGPDAYVVVYAQQDTQCDDCICGACFSRDSTPALACTSGCSPDMLSAGVPLDLSPGRWAVVVEIHAADGLLFASQCVDATVDSDGTADETAQTMTCTSCVTDSSSPP